MAKSIKITVLEQKSLRDIHSEHLKSQLRKQGLEIDSDDIQIGDVYIVKPKSWNGLTEKNIRAACKETFGGSRTMTKLVIENVKALKE